MSSLADVVTVYAPGKYRDAHNAERFYAAFEVWLHDHRASMRGSQADGTVPSLSSFHDAGMCSGHRATIEGTTPSDGRTVRVQHKVKLAKVAPLSAGRGARSGARSTGGAKRRSKEAGERAHHAGKK
jgi:hypothetical protein